MQDSKLVYDQLGILAQSPIPCVQNLHCTRVPHVTQGMELALGAGVGMSTLGQWHGPWNYEMETVTTINGKSNWVWHENGNKKYANNMQEICKEYAKNMQRICKTYARNMHENMQEICEICVKYAS